MNEKTAASEAGFSGGATGYAEAALSLYKPPFRYENGWIWDANNQFVADEGGPSHQEPRMARIRGWGRIQYLPNPEQLQDEIGRMMAEALTEYWSRHNVAIKPRRQASA